MPYYDFECPVCGKQVEGYGLPELKEGPLCRKCDVQTIKQFPAPNFSVKGHNEANGYHAPKSVNDYAPK